MSLSCMTRLREILSEDEYLELLEHFAGCRVWVSKSSKKGSLLEDAIGTQAYKRLFAEIGEGQIKVPLDRETRCIHYLARGMTNTEIAVRLGVTESAVLKMKKRVGVESHRRLPLSQAVRNYDLRLFQAHKKGLSNQEIARLLGVSSSSVYRSLGRLGLRAADPKNGG